MAEVIQLPGTRLQSCFKMSAYPNTLRVRFDEVYSYARYFLGASAGARTSFVLLAQYRSGSSLLQNLLAAHPQVRCDGEVLLKFLRSRPPWVLLPGAYVRAGRTRAQASTYGCILRLDQLEKCLIPGVHGDPQAFVRDLHDEGWQFIHLVRRNCLRQAVSNLVAHARGSWHHRAGDEKPSRRVSVDSDRVIAWAEWNERVLSDELRMLDGLSCLRLTYEDDLLPQEQHQPSLNRVFEFLGLPSVEVTASLRRTSGDCLADVLENHEEVVAQVRQTRFAHYLDSSRRTPPSRLMN